ncbi:hypothetical protein HanIR_Chr11g0526841 [Helianthus annuus]|nr:hypothetical protein HanIR_Chr11g0526841 [Helianthus annuus]
MHKTGFLEPSPCLGNLVNNWFRVCLGFYRVLTSLVEFWMVWVQVQVEPVPVVLVRFLFLNLGLELVCTCGLGRVRTSSRSGLGSKPDFLCTSKSIHNGSPIYL